MMARGVDNHGFRPCGVSKLGPVRALIEAGRVYIPGPSLLPAWLSAFGDERHEFGDNPHYPENGGARDGR